MSIWQPSECRSPLVENEVHCRFIDKRNKKITITEINDSKNVKSFGPNYSSTKEACLTRSLGLIEYGQSVQSASE